MKNSINNENSLNEYTIKMSENEIKDLKRFWKDIKWYEREFAINHAIKTAEIASEIVTQQAVIPEDLKKRCDIAIENLKTLSVLNSKDKPSKISLKLFEIKTKVGLTDYDGKSNASPNLRMCLAAVSCLSNNDRDKLDKYLDIEDIIKQARLNSYSYEKTYFALFSEPSYTSSAMFFAFSNYMGHEHFQ